MRKLFAQISDKEKSAKMCYLPPSTSTVRLTRALSSGIRLEKLRKKQNERGDGKTSPRSKKMLQDLEKMERILQSITLMTMAAKRRDPICAANELNAKGFNQATFDSLVRNAQNERPMIENGEDKQEDGQDTATSPP